MERNRSTKELREFKVKFRKDIIKASKVYDLTEYEMTILLEEILIEIYAKSGESLLAINNHLGWMYAKYKSLIDSNGHHMIIENL